MGSRPAVAGWLVSPATTPDSLTASQVPPASSSLPPRILGPAAWSTVMATAGRSSNSSRLAATIRGDSGWSRETVTSRHIARTVPIPLWPHLPVGQPLAPPVKFHAARRKVGTWWNQP